MITNDSKIILTDLIQGDEQVAKREEFTSLTQEDLALLSKLFVNNPELSDKEKSMYLGNLWRVNYITRPPTPEEFLSPKYLGEVADLVYPHVKEVFIEFLNPNSKKRVLALSTSIGFGKTTLSVLIILYIIVQFSYMRNVKKFLNINVAGSLVAALMSFSLKKGNQLLTQPFANILRSSPIFHRTIKEDRLVNKQEEIGNENIAYTTAGRMGAFQFSKDLHIIVMSDRSALLGLNIFAGVASEISFWANRGVSLEEIWGVWNDLRGRINSRFYSRYLTASILDSSPLDLNLSPIDKWLYSGEAQKDPEVMFVNKKHWEVYDWKYPKWQKTKETFPVFRGDASRPCKFIEDHEVNTYTPDDIFNVPIDLWQQFHDDLKKSIADYCAYPSGSDSKLITNFQKIEDSFYKHLKNVYKFIYAPANQNSKGLIWDQLVDQFFVKIGDNYEFYRFPEVPRYIHIDCSEVKDTSGISCVHMEMNNQGDRVVVADFTIPILATRDRINLDAISDFIMDLLIVGRLRIKHVSADRYQSAAMIQRFKREGLNADHLSVDRETTPYKVVTSWLLTGKVKVGYNIMLKNNWKSLVEVKSDSGHIKIDHIKMAQPVKDGDWNWDTSQVGFGAKDITDSLVGASFSCIEGEPISTSSAIWEESEIVANEQTALDRIRKEFSLKVRV